MSTLTRRHVIVAAAALGATVAGLSACSSGGEPAAGGPVTLRFAWWGSTARHEMTQQVLDAFTEAHPDVTVTGEPGDFSGYFDRLATQTAAGDAPDIISLGGAYVAEYAQRGALLDLGEVTEQLDLGSFMDDTAVTNGQVEGTQYAATTGVNALAMMANPAVFEKAKIDIPDDTSWSWEEYADLAAELTAKTPDGTYGSSGTLTHDSIDCWARQRGESLYTPDGELGLTLETITGLFELSKRLVDTKAAPPPTLITELDGAPNEQTLMGTNRAATMLTWSNGLGALSTASGQQLRLLDVPGEAGHPGLWLQSSQYFAIYAKSAHPEQAATLINFMVNSDEAGAIVKTDRGVPASAEVRTAITDDLDAAGKAEVAYIDHQSTKDLQQLVIGPAGSTAVADITTRALSEVMFGRTSPSAAAETWMTEAEQAIQQ